MVTGDAKGKRGIVTGHHGGAEHVMIDFADDVLKRLNMDDKFLVHAWGQGLKLLDYPDVHVINLDPNLLRKMGTGDYDIMTTDREEIAELGLDKLRFGDFVAITDHDNTFGRSWRKGAVTAGIVIHSDCLLAGHGPGVTTLISCAKPLIVPKVDSNANLGKILKIGRFRPAKKKAKAKKKK